MAVRLLPAIQETRKMDTTGERPAGEASRGRDAERPSQIGRRGWWDVLVRVKEEMGEDNASLIAAGLALYALLAVFPGLTAAVSLYGLLASPDQVASQFQSIAGILPQQAAEILRGAMQGVASKQGGTLGFGVAAGILIALWSARKGMVALMQATNIAYDENESRGFFRQILVSLAFTLGAILGFLLVLMLAVAVPVALQQLGLPQILEVVLAVVRWAILWFLVVLGLAVVYRFAPDRNEPKWRWVTWGSAIAATLWIAGSILFALYVRNFGSYGATYGALGGVVILLMWFYLSGFIVILGAEINAEMEHQTGRDTTRGRPEPMGERGAHVADTLGHRA